MEPLKHKNTFEHKEILSTGDKFNKAIKALAVAASLAIPSTAVSQESLDSTTENPMRITTPGGIILAHLTEMTDILTEIEQDRIKMRAQALEQHGNRGAEIWDNLTQLNDDISGARFHIEALQRRIAYVNNKIGLEGETEDYTMAGVEELESEMETLLQRLNDLESQLNQADSQWNDLHQ